jgi:two-component system cell cycle sensor histidine kinase/response regulator CckA
METRYLPAKAREDNTLQAGHWLLHSRRIKLLSEAALILALGAAVFAAAHRYRIFRGVAGWILRREESLADEVFVTLIVLGVLGLVFTIRRLRDLHSEVTARRKAQFSLQSLHVDLEDRVRSRTEELEHSEARYRALFDQSPLPMWLFEEESLRFLDVNQAAVDHYGYSREEFLGMTLKDIRPPEEVPGLLAVERSRSADRQHHGIWKHRKKDGGTIDVDVHTHGISVAGKSVSLAVLKDVTQERRLEEQLRQSQKMEAIGALAGGIAHDFNNLLTTILGFADLARAQLEPGASLVEDIDEIISAGNRASALTRQLLTFSRKQLVEPTVLDLGEVVGELDRMLRRLLGERIELRSLVSADLERVKADRGEVEQVIMNLAINARDAMPRGGCLTIEASNVELDETYAETQFGVTPGEYVLLAISDDGTGMDAGTQERIFEPFFTTKEAGKGTGLGLSTVYGIVKKSGGHISVYSEPGKGTTFKVYLPRCGEGRPAWSQEAAPKPIGGNETILLVEDQEPVRKLTRTILSGYGYRVMEAAGGAEAIEEAHSSKAAIHLVLSDAVMPGMELSEMLDRLGAMHPEARVLLMSGYTDETVLRHHIREKNTSFLPKPFTARGLASKVRQVLDAA